MKDRLLTLTHPMLFGMGCLLALVFHLMNPRNNPLDARIISLKKEITASQDKLKQTIERTQNKAKFQEEVDQVSQTVRLALEYLPKDFDMQDLLKKIYSEARNSGVQLTRMVPKDSVGKDFYDELPMGIELRGSYPQIVLFLSYVSKLPRIINIKNVELADVQFNDGLPVMKLSGTLMAYRYKESK